jgi:tRNA acetyltransferase TAN1
MSSEKKDHKSKGKKRQYHNSSGNQANKNKWQPKRGGPGVILTCDTGRDSKAKREGMEILNYYYKLSQKEDPKAEEEAEDENKQVSLEDELAQLKSDNNSHKGKDHGPFGVYDAGCRGNVILMCTLPNSALVPIVPAKKEKPEEEGEPDAKKSKTEEPIPPPLPIINNCWDPTEAVRQIMNEIHKESTDPDYHNPQVPGSRFVTRIIPLQATCFASMEEINLTFRALMDHYILPKLAQQQPQDKTTTFAIKFKKRNCGHITRDQLIQGIVAQLDEATHGKEWKVNLDQPDYRIQVEICKTLCGISVLHATHEDMVKHNFNLADLRANAGTTKSTADSSGKSKKENDQPKKDDGDEEE